MRQDIQPNLDGSNHLLTVVSQMLDKTKQTASIFVGGKSDSKETRDEINPNASLLSALQKAQASQLPTPLQPPLTVQQCVDLKLPPSFANQKDITFDMFIKAKLPANDFVYINGKLNKIAENREQAYIDGVKNFIRQGDTENKRKKYPEIFLADEIVSLTNRLITYKNLTIPATLTKSPDKMANFKALLQHHHTVVDTYDTLKKIIEKTTIIDAKTKGEIFANLAKEQQGLEVFLNTMILQNEQIPLAIKQLSYIKANIEGGDTVNKDGEQIKTNGIKAMHKALDANIKSLTIQQINEEINKISSLIESTKTSLATLRPISQSLESDKNKSYKNFKEGTELYSKIDKKYSEYTKDLEKISNNLIEIGLKATKNLEENKKEEALFQQLIMYAQNKNEKGVEILLKQPEIANLLKKEECPSYVKKDQLTTLANLHKPMTDDLHKHLVKARCNEEINLIKKDFDKDSPGLQQPLFNKLLVYLRQNNTIGVELILKENVILQMQKLSTRPSYILPNHLIELSQSPTTKQLLDNLTGVKPNAQQTSTSSMITGLSQPDLSLPKPPTITSPLAVQPTAPSTTSSPSSTPSNNELRRPTIFKKATEEPNNATTSSQAPSSSPPIPPERKNGPRM